MPGAKLRQDLPGGRKVWASSAPGLSLELALHLQVRVRLQAEWFGVQSAVDGVNGPEC